MRYFVTYQMFQFQFDSKKVTWSFSGYEYWIGLNQMFSLTNQNKMFQLRVTMKKLNQTMRIETYNSFKILDNVIFSLCIASVVFGANYLVLWQCTYTGISWIYSKCFFNWCIKFYLKFYFFQILSQINIQLFNLGNIIRFTTHFKFLDHLQVEMV